jgi:hypothetical protein
MRNFAAKALRSLALVSSFSMIMVYSHDLNHVARHITKGCHIIRSDAACQLGLSTADTEACGPLLYKSVHMA